MESTFMQKVVLIIIAGFFAACLIQFYKIIIVGAERAVNTGVQHRTKAE